MEIRLLSPDDNLVEYMECVSDLNSADQQLSNLRDIAEALIDRPKNILTFVMVTDDSHILATATIMIEKKLRYKRLCCHIEDVGVHPDHRNKGYGKQMIDFCKAVAKKNNCYKIKLSCYEELVNFYNKCDFKVNGFHMYTQGETL